MRFVLLGEQATGKSSLLVALYGALVNHRAGDLRIVRTVDEVEFLSRGLQAFGHHQSVRRTAVDSNERLLIELAHGDRVVTLDLPDRSGELLKHMLDARVWDPELRRQLAAASGALLFLRADQPASDGTPGANGVLPDGHAYGQTAAPVPWTPAQMPPDVRAVDLLQELLEERSGSFPLVVVISAWDAVAAGRLGPRDWLAERAPLLEQFLTSNGQQLPNAVFGVSAQGADFNGGLADGTADQDPWDRSFAVGEGGIRGSLAEPLLWLLDAATR